MKWKKIGRIFEFENSPFKTRYISHAQSPQAVVYETFVRVYFSTRTLDESGKFLSHVQFVDYDKNFQSIINHSEHEVIPLGNLGCFDEHGIFPLSPLRFKDEIFAYTNGWARRVSVDVDSGIGFAISSDNGLTFQKKGNGPILSASINEPFLLGDAFVRVFDDVFYMYYIFGQKWSEPTPDHPSERVYKIGFAVSNDGITWEKKNRCIIESKIDENECQALPTVIKIGNRYHMYFCYRHMLDFRTKKENGYRLGYAYSDDLNHWVRNDDKAGITTSNGSWDSDMMCYPNIVEVEGKIFLLYNGNEFGKHGFGLAVLEDIHD